MNQSDKQAFSSGLSQEHSALLEWYFGTGRATFGRSTCGAIIDRLLMFSYGSDPCGSCRGTGFRGGWSYGDAPKALPGEELAALIGIEREKSNGADDPDAVCPKCLGSGVQARKSRRRQHEQLTARPKPESQSGAGYTPTDFALQHYAIACRRIDIVNRSDARAAAVLEAFFGDWGGRWADTKQGRLFAVYSLTGAGHKLLRMSLKKAALEDHELPPHEVLGVEFELQTQQPNNTRRDLFNAAREQAQGLLEKACRVWNASVPSGEVWRREQREAKRKVQRDARIREILAGAFEWEPEPYAPTCQECSAILNPLERGCFEHGQPALCFTCAQNWRVPGAVAECVFGERAAS